MSIFDVDYINYVWTLLVPPDKRQPNWLAWGNALMTGKQWKGDTFFDGYTSGAGYLEPPVTTTTNAYDPTATYVTGDRVIYLIQAGGAYYGDNGLYEAISINPDGTNNGGFSGIPPVNNPPSSPDSVYIVPPVAPPSVNTTAQALQWLSGFYWIPVQPIFVGANFRVMHSAQKLIFEHLLNVWFVTTFRQPAVGTPDIYINTNTVTEDTFYFLPYEDTSFFNQTTNFSPSNKPISMYFFPTAPSGPQNDFSIYIPVGYYNALDAEAHVTAGHNTTLRDAIVRAIADKVCPAGAFYNIITY